MGWTRNDQIIQRIKVAIGIIAVKKIGQFVAFGGCTLKRVWRDVGTGIVFNAVYPVGISS
jgi:hypothetical protein